ncbi:MAG: hypothetical protein DMF68_11960 [Acidobacteria bacterium]|nr:MAG: hypothetical protein DMF68_11960 [Acidobacteriota bacterium]
MTVQGILVLNLIAIALLVWIGNLIRRGRLYVGYGVIFIAVTLCVIIVLDVPRLLTLVIKMVGAVFPVSALVMLALGFIVFMLIYILAQLTMLSNRLTILVQTLAIERAEAQAKLSVGLEREATSAREERGHASK